MSEKLLWHKLRAKIRLLDLPGRWERVENGVSVGMPDVNYCVNGFEGWIELKHGKMPAKKDTVIFKSQRGLEQEQVNWHYIQVKNGGISWIFMELSGDFYGIPGSLAGEINQYTVEDVQKYQISLEDFLVFRCIQNTP
jgi:hypothetical protein